MNKQEQLPPWWEIIKGMPAYTAENFRLMVIYWRKASLRIWVVEILWLAILVAMFYYSVQGMVSFFEGSTSIEPKSALGVFMLFSPLWFVFLIFIAHSVFESIVRAIFTWMDNRGY